MKQPFVLIADYLESLEQRIAALETRITELESRPVATEVKTELQPVVVPMTEPEPVTEPEPEPVAEPEPVTEHNPVQTSLFGAPVEDIRRAISLGDRFLFQRELFGGNGELMQQTLDRINKLDSFEQAVEYITAFGWDTESTAYNLFINTLHRRF